MPDTFTISDQRAHTAIAMATSEVSAFERFLRTRADALRAEAELIEAFLEGRVDGWGKHKTQIASPSYETRSWYDVITKERDAAFAAAKA